MNFQCSTSGVIRPDGSYRQFGHVDKDYTGNAHVATVDFQFRQATNGVIVNTLVNDEPLITTSEGQF